MVNCYKPIIEYLEGNFKLCVKPFLYGAAACFSILLMKIDLCHRGQKDLSLAAWNVGFKMECDRRDTVNITLAFRSSLIRSFIFTSTAPISTFR